VVPPPAYVPSLSTTWRGGPFSSWKGGDLFFKRGTFLPPFFWPPLFADQMHSSAFPLQKKTFLPFFFSFGFSPQFFRWGIMGLLSCGNNWTGVSLFFFKNSPLPFFFSRDPCSSDVENTFFWFVKTSFLFLETPPFSFLKGRPSSHYEEVVFFWDFFFFSFLLSFYVCVPPFPPLSAPLVLSLLIGAKEFLNFFYRKKRVSLASREGFPPPLFLSTLPICRKKGRRFLPCWTCNSPTLLPVCIFSQTFPPPLFTIFV